MVGLPQKIGKYAQNMRKYAHSWKKKNPKYAQNRRKYAEICAAHINPPCVQGGEISRNRKITITGIYFNLLQILRAFTKKKKMTLDQDP